ncbi:MAG TPA: hypothetical protein DEP62_07540, partial [Flavobacteriales bacterium]|nr:hypothetical protein [Flavobacteriales bacterium]
CSTSAAFVAETVLLKAHVTVKATFSTSAAFAEAQELLKAIAIVKETNSMCAEFAVEMVTSDALTLTLVIMTREPVETMVAAMSHSRVAKSVWMVYPPQSTQTVMA